jgi:exonuclease VII small subunit
MSEETLETDFKKLEKARKELEEKKKAYKTAIALLHQMRLNIQIKEKTVKLLEQNYLESAVEIIEKELSLK